MSMQEITVQETQAVVGGYTIQGIPGLSIREGTVVSWAPSVSVTVNGVSVDRAKLC
jgi:hypothetical protein